MQKHTVDIYSECPFDKVSQRRVTLSYAMLDNNQPFQIAAVCHSYHDGYTTCQKCIAFFSLYVDKYGVPKERQAVTPELKR